MTHATPKNGLHLPTLTIAAFRGIRELSIGRLGRVTLLTGNNGVGKTTVLEAVRVFAARGRQSTLSSLLRDRDEYAAEADDDDDKIRALDFAALFFGRSPSQERISIGPVAIAHQLTIEEVALTEEQLSLVEGLIPELPSDGTVRSLLSRFEGTKQILPFFSMDAGPSADDGTQGLRLMRPESWDAPWEPKRVLPRSGAGPWGQACCKTTRSRNGGTTLR